MHVLVIALLILWWSWPIGLALFALLIFMSRGKVRRCGADRAHRQLRRLASTGNAAFDEYREEALHRLQQERDKFREFLERLRKAKDKEEFDKFMSDRRARQTNGPQGATA